jgi:hypothetical protein
LFSSFKSKKRSNRYELVFALLLFPVSQLEARRPERAFLLCHGVIHGSAKQDRYGGLRAALRSLFDATIAPADSRSLRYLDCKNTKTYLAV